jgi:formate dehydrogenase accessory protein FdhD
MRVAKARTQCGSRHYRVIAIMRRTTAQLYEDVGRHDAIDKIAGYIFLNGIQSAAKLLYTTGRLTSEMVIKIVRTEIPILIGRANGSHLVALSGAERIIFDANPGAIDEAGQTPKAGVATDA